MNNMADEKIYTIPLGKAYDYIRTKRVRRAITLVRQFVARHSKVAEKNVRLSNMLNAHMWERGVQKPPRRIKIKIVKDGTIARAYLADEKVAKAEEKKVAAETKEEKKTEQKQQATAEEKKDGSDGEGKSKPTKK